VDYQGVETLVEWYWKKGCDGIFAVCQSSEIFFLTLEERVKVGKTVVEKAKALAAEDKSRKPMKIVVSGHVSDSFDDQVEELTAMSSVGADALILISNRMDIENTLEEKWIEDLHKLIEKLPKDIPLGIYECPKPYKRLLTEKILKACKENGIHTAVDTAGHVPYASFEKILPYTDLFLYDVKCFSEDTHKRYVGASNSLILENLKKLLKTGKKIWIRVPIICSVNDSESEMQKIKDFIYSAGKPEKIELLPYHAMGVHKYSAIGKTPIEFEVPSALVMEKLRNVF
jgi:hypothetical protein